MTFLFTDIEGSTRRWEDAAEAMREALVAHDAVLRQAIEMHGGFVFKHTGDGMCAAFASPKGALDGPVLNRTARVKAAGHGGRKLVAMSTAVLLAGHEMLVDR